MHHVDTSGQRYLSCVSAATVDFSEFPCLAWFVFFASSGLAWPSLCLFARTGGGFCFQTLFRRHAFPPAIQSYWIRLERQVRIPQPAPSVSAGTLFPKSWLQAAEIPNSLLYVHSKAR
ncbi:hypothetical protein CSPX01_09985 [Colletotrichum filicis]|nr:hypothetical protein CSPX01_09985 [Colletotrichum filicis]